MSFQSSVGVSMVITFMVDYVIIASVRCTDWCLLIYLPILESLYIVYACCATRVYIHHIVSNRLTHCLLCLGLLFHST